MFSHLPFNSERRPDPYVLQPGDGHYVLISFSFHFIVAGVCDAEMLPCRSDVGSMGRCLRHPTTANVGWSPTMNQTELSN